MAFVLSFVLMLSGCAMRLGRLNDNQRAETLAAETGELCEIRSPLQRTKSYIAISQLLLDFVSSAAEDHDIEAMGKRLDHYTSAIRSARDTIVSSDGDPVRKPAGFKDLELALREQARR